MNNIHKASHLAVALGLVFALASGCKRSPDVPRQLIEKAIDQALPNTKGIDLTLESKIDENGRIEIRCKFRRERLVTTYRMAERKGPDGTMDSPMSTELNRVGLVVVKPSPHPGSIALTYDPAADPLLSDLVLLEPVETAGSRFEGYGRMEVRRFLDKWEHSDFETDIRTKGRTLQEFRGPPADGGLRQQLFGRAETRYFVLGSEEWENHLTEAVRARDARLARFAAKDTELRAAFRPGLIYWLDYRSESNLPSTWVKVTVGPGNGADRRRVTFVEMEGSRRQKAFVVDLTALDRPRRKSTAFLPDDSEYYRDAPEIPPVLAMNAEAKIGLEGWTPIFSDHAPVLTGSIQDGNLILYEVVQKETYQARTALPPGVRVSSNTREDSVPVSTSLPKSDGAGATPSANAPLRGDVRALTERAHAIFQGRVSGSKSEAIELYAEAARAGDADAAVNLGHVYRAGRLVQRDLERARRLYEQAAAAGNVEAEQALRGMR